MSAEATGYVFKSSPYKGATFAVHLAIADSVNDQHEHRFFMSVTNLSAKARCSRRAAQYALQTMIERGHLELLEDNANFGKPSEYRFVSVPEGGATVAQGGAGAAHRGAQPATQGGATSAPKPKRTQETTQVDGEPSQDDASAPADWSAHADTKQLLERLAWRGSPLIATDLGDPVFWDGIDTLTEHTSVFYHDELRSYVAWLNHQPPSFRRTNHRRGFTNWIRKAIARQDQDWRKRA